jgi:hypothetical protein
MNYVFVHNLAVSHLLFLESPAGVGFSYSNTTSDYVTGDKKTGKFEDDISVEDFGPFLNLKNSPDIPLGNRIVPNNSTFPNMTCKLACESVVSIVR